MQIEQIGLMQNKKEEKKSLYFKLSHQHIFSVYTIIVLKNHVLRDSPIYQLLVEHLHNVLFISQKWIKKQNRERL